MRRLDEVRRGDPGGNAGRRQARRRRHADIHHGSNHRDRGRRADARRSAAICTVRRKAQGSARLRNEVVHNRKEPRRRREMKKVVWTLAVLALTCGTAQAQDVNELVPAPGYQAPAAAPLSALDKALIANERKVADALMKKDRATLTSLM